MDKPVQDSVTSSMKSAKGMQGNAPVNTQIRDHLNSWWRRALLNWESMLLVVAVCVFIINSFASPYFLDPWNLSDATFNFTEKAIVAFAMALLIVSGEIDLSVASIIALVSTAMGFVAQFGFGVPVLVVVGIAVGLMCGAFNGFLVTVMGLPSIVVTIGTMSLFRGISYIVLGDQAYTEYPSELAFFGQGYVWWVVSFELVLFLICAVIFGVLLHKTQFGRAVTIIGNNATGAMFSGIRVQRVKFVLFMLTGLMSAIAAICLTSRLGSTRPSIAVGWELEIITIVVLGGVNILGGSGTILGVVIASFVLGMVTFGFGLLNVPGIMMSIFVGLMLISVIALPRIWEKVSSSRSRQ